MQAPTHLLTGMLIQTFANKVRLSVARIFIVAIFAFFSHVILDGLARFTYHPPDFIANEFWISYHLIISVFTVYIVLKYWKKYKLGLVFSVLPDMDWLILHSSELLSIRIPSWSELILHKVSFGFLRSLPQLGFLNSFPNLMLDEKASVVEIVPMLIMITYFYLKEAEPRETRKIVSTNEQRIGEKRVDKEASTKWVERLSAYQTAMAQEQSIRIGYQSLLTTLEIALFGLWFTLLQFNLTMYPWLLAVVGIVLCIFFGTACEFRARNVDVWNRRIVELVSGTDLEDAFKESKYRWIPFGKSGYWGNYLFGHWYERILIPMMMTVWLYLLWFLENPFYLIGIIAAWLWILYAFNILRLKEEYYDYRKR